MKATTQKIRTHLSYASVLGNGLICNSLHTLYQTPHSNLSVIGPKVVGIMIIRYRFRGVRTINLLIKIGDLLRFLFGKTGAEIAMIFNLRLNRFTFRLLISPTILS